ncbi:Si:ch211-105d4.5 [Strongyloides ratti]|uniref:Si:ch211-105d4.5 n=1 Tax=Strongyloides ratti TaxID=34506 RepID=A0A090KZC0_STRRB|nr:Si:ch211-105d4.5 [Strongyloides ratti]CEF62761.1 Si:ch211-105d4.5 [Strongyloides ratti]
MIGKWRSEFGGKVTWPTIPTMTFGEEIEIGEGYDTFVDNKIVHFLNFTAKAWSHTNKDQFHSEWGHLIANRNGQVTLMTSGGNGFAKYEVGSFVNNDKIILNLKDIGRISFSRDLPVEDLRRTFVKVGDNYMEQILEMRTATHPETGLLRHSKVVYSRIK